MARKKKSEANDAVEPEVQEAPAEETPTMEAGEDDSRSGFDDFIDTALSDEGDDDVDERRDAGEPELEEEELEDSEEATMEGGEASEDEEPAGEEPEEDDEPEPLAAEAPEEQTPAEPPPAEESVEGPVPTREELEERYQTWRTAAYKRLVDQHFQLSDEEREALEEVDPTGNLAKVLPALQARVYLDAVTGAVGHLLSVLPQAVTRVTAQTGESRRAEQEFYRTWPKLNKQEHRETILRLGTAYRRVNPRASREQFIREVGAQAHVALKIPIETRRSQGEQRRQPAFKPAASSAPAAAARPKTPANPFAQLADEILSEDVA